MQIKYYQIIPSRCKSQGWFHITSRVFPKEIKKRDVRYHYLKYILEVLVTNHVNPYLSTQHS